MGIHFIAKTITYRLKQSDKIIVVFGARQVGKTTLIKKYLRMILVRFWKSMPIS
jgi:predicted AAA+ superfamily ATPase